MRFSRKDTDDDEAPRTEDDPDAHGSDDAPPPDGGPDLAPDLAPEPHPAPEPERDLSPSAAAPAPAPPQALAPATAAPDRPMTPQTISNPTPAELEPRRPVGMVPARNRTSSVEKGFVRIIATGGIVGLDVALSAVLVGQNVQGWVVGLAVGLLSVILAAILWSSREL